MKRILTLIMALMAISLALFAGGSAEETDPNAPIKIGSIQDLSGSASNAG